MEQNKNRTYTLNDIYIEVWKDEHIEDIERMEVHEYKEAVKQVKSEYRKRLNTMFNVLFGCEYNEVLITQAKGRNKYLIGDNCKNFIVFLLETYSEKNGKILRSGKFEKNDSKYSELDRKYENGLLYYASQYLKERKEQENEDSIKTEELAKKLTEKFGMESGKIRLIEALTDFTNLINDLLYESEIVDTSKLEKVYEEVSFLIKYGTMKGHGIVYDDDIILSVETLKKIKEAIVSYREMLEEENYYAESIDKLAKHILARISSEYEDEFLI